ncbi:MAG: hypothetical protein ACOCZI_01445 [Marinilabiliaceae bacterium]
MKIFKTIIFSISAALVSTAAFVLFRPCRRKSETSASSGFSSAGTSSFAGEADSDTLYKTAGVKRLELKDVPGDVSPSTINDLFTGEAVVKPGEHDKYNVNVFDEQGVFLGRIGKNRRLSHSLSVWHGGRQFVFGRLVNEVDGTRHGTVFVPAGFDDKQIERLNDVFEKLRKRHDILSTPVVSSQEYLEILDDHKYISSVLFEMGIFDEIDVSLSKKIIPALSRQLEEEEDWDGLIKLEQHNDLIDELSERFAGTTYRRISKAKKIKGEKK